MEQSRRDKGLWNKITIALFAGLLTVLFLIGCAFPERPEHSEIEKRELAEFPQVTAAGIWDGSFFSSLETWYADTYPIREPMILGQQRVEGLYGDRRTAIYGNTIQYADEIPEVSETDSAAASSSGTSAESNASSASAASGKSAGEAVSSASTASTVSSASTASTESSASTASTVPSASTASTGSSASTASSALAKSSAASSSADADSEEAGGTIKDMPEVAGTILVVDGRGFETYYFIQKNADDYAAMLNAVRSKLPDDVNLFDMVIPNSFGVCLDDSVQQSVGASNQRDTINYIYSQLGSGVTPVSIFDTLRKHDSEYIYFNTDHHWTALGAYYAYVEFCKAKGIQPHDLSDFEERDFDGFLGSFYAYSGQSQELAANPDTVKAYVPISTNDMTYTSMDGKTISWSVIQDVTSYPADVKYSTFIGGDEPYSVIDNPEISDGNSCLVIKESYGNAFVPFLVDHYDKVFVCDYRYYKGNLTQLVRDRGIRDVLFLNNTEAVVSSRAAMMNSLFR